MGRGYEAVSVTFLGKKYIEKMNGSMAKIIVTRVHLIKPFEPEVSIQKSSKNFSVRQAMGWTDVEGSITNSEAVPLVEPAFQFQRLTITESALERREELSVLAKDCVSDDFSIDFLSTFTIEKPMHIRAHSISSS